MIQLAAFVLAAAVLDSPLPLWVRLLAFATAAVNVAAFVYGIESNPAPEGD